jgi:activating signal cointegrator complex subunit 3
MCRLLCDSPEFAEVPVRHNEDELNEKFSQKLPWDSKGSDFSSPHVKSLLLLQARLARAPVPITDYVNDTKSVLDQSLRVLNSLVDVAADFGKLRAAFSAMLLTQCLVQAQLPDQSEITQLPHIEDTHAATLSGILGFRYDKDDEKMRLSTLAGHSDEEIKKALTSQTVRLSNSQASDVLKVLHSLPWLQVTWTARQGSATLASKSTSTEIINVQTSSDTIDVEIEIQAPTAQVVGRNAWAPRFRQKTYSWWIIISNSINDELLAIKRISQHSGQARHNLSVDSPTSVGSHEWEISVISDTLRGLDVKKKLSLIAS